MPHECRAKTAKEAEEKEFLSEDREDSFRVAASSGELSEQVDRQ
jgi:hypothetical protein